MIKLVRLSSGEELIGDVKETHDGITLSDAIILIPAGEGKIGFMPFMPYTEASDGISISNQFIVFMVKPVQNLIDNHREATGKIALPPSSIIL